MTCNNRHPDLTFLSCEHEDNRHKGDHFWDPANGDPPTTWTNDRDRKSSGFGNRARRRPQKETYEHEISEAVTDGIKGELISQQLLLYGQAFCVKCKRPLSPKVPMGARLVEEHVETYVAAFKEAMRLSDKHHTDGRTGHGYMPKKYGNDWGRDLPIFIEAPICRDCHTGDDSEIHPGVQLGRSAALTDGGGGVSLTKNEATRFQNEISSRGHSAVIEELVRNRQGFGLRIGKRLLTQFEEAQAFVEDLQQTKGALST